jgi:hypothetical protein
MAKEGKLGLEDKKLMAELIKSFAREVRKNGK